MNAPVRASVVAIVGHPRPQSPTVAAAWSVAALLARYLGSGSPQVFDLAAGAAPFGENAADALATELGQVGRAAALVIASPTSNGSYTGLLKAFLDLVPAQGLLGTVAFPLMTLASPAHSLAAEVHLRPVLQELGASLPAPSLVLTSQDLADLEPVVEDWWSVAESALSGIGPLSRHAAYSAYGTKHSQVASGLRRSASG